MNPADPLPRKLRITYIAITEFPRTNSITITGIVMFIATGIFLAFASMQNVDFKEFVLALWLGAVLSLLGLGNWAEQIKRSLPYPAPPARQDAETVAATQGTTTTPPAVLGQTDADLAARTLERTQATIREQKG